MQISKVERFKFVEVSWPYFEFWSLSVNTIGISLKSVLNSNFFTYEMDIVIYPKISKHSILDIGD